MKMRQAWTWLFAGVVAAGLNASYHDGGLRWAHRGIERVGHSVDAVLALATGRADRFVLAANMIRAQRDSASCPLANSWAEVQDTFEGDVQNNIRNEIQSEVQQSVRQKVWEKIQSKIAAQQSQFDRFEVVSARRQAEMARWEAQRDRVQAQVAHLRIPAAGFNPVDFKTVMVQSAPACTRIRVNVPRTPVLKMPAIPEVRVEMGSAGPV